MNLKPKLQGLCANVIIDSKIMPNNLKIINKTEEWLKHELNIKGYSDIDNIILATIDNNEKLTIYEKNEDISPLNVLE